MGYRSDGGMVIFGPKDKMIAHLAALRMTQTNLDAWTCPEVRIYEVGERMFYRLEYCDWKWYNEYPEIAEFNRIWQESEESEDGSIGGFRWRFGEDDSDIDQDSFGENAYFEVVVERHAVFEIPDPPETPGG